MASLGAAAMTLLMAAPLALMLARMAVPVAAPARGRDGLGR